MHPTKRSGRTCPWGSPLGPGVTQARPLMLVGKGLSSEQPADTGIHETWGDTHTVRHLGTPSNLDASSPGPSSALPPTAPPSLIHSRTSQGSRSDGSVLSQALCPAAHGQQSQDRKAGPWVRTGLKGLEPSRGEDSGPGRAFSLQEMNPSGKEETQVSHVSWVCEGSPGWGLGRQGPQRLLPGSLGTVGRLQ